eukprot:g16211.t1
MANPSIVFGEAVKWSTVEGVATTFVALGVGGISAGTCVLTFMLTKTLPQFSDEASQLYVSDPRGMAVAAGLVSMLMSLSVLHHFITIADTMAYCKGLLEHEKKMAEPQVEERKGTCWSFGRAHQPTKLHAKCNAALKAFGKEEIDWKLPITLEEG